MSKTAKAVRYDEIEGKTVAGVGFVNNMLIAFTDGTALFLRAEQEHDGASIDFLQGRDVDLTSKQWSLEAHEAGLLTREEWLATRQSDKEAEIKRLESRIASLKAEARP